MKNNKRVFSKKVRAIISLSLVAMLILSCCPLNIAAAADFVYPSQPTGLTGNAQYKTALTSGIHDNEFFYEDGYWYTMWTNTNAIRRSTNLVNWSNVSGGTRNGSAWAPVITKLTIDGAERILLLQLCLE